MPWKWSERSLMNLATCRPELRQIAHRALALSPFDISCTEGWRGEAAQNEHFEQGRSHLRWPESKHNTNPCNAIHLDPYPIDYSRAGCQRYYTLAGVIYAAALELGLEDRLRWGGDWDGDWDFSDQKFNDLAHWEFRE